MKKTFQLLIPALLISLSCFSQDTLETRQHAKASYLTTQAATDSIAAMKLLIDTKAPTSALSWNNISGRPTTVSGYGISDAYPLTGNPGAFLTSVSGSQITTALGYTPTNPNGSSSQYIAGDGSKISFPTVPTSNSQLTNGAGFITAAALDSMQIFTSAGRIRQKLKMWTGILTPTISAGYVVDISSAGFSNILSISLMAGSNSSTAVTVPLASLKSYSTSALNINLVVSNNATISSLVSPIVGLVFPPSVTGYTLSVIVIGY